MTRAGAALRRTLPASQAALGAIDVYLLALLAAAALPARRAPADGRELRLLVLVPAHDEAAGIGVCLDALQRSAHPADRRHVVVVADNCADATATVARRDGVTVLERHDPERRGKGHALNWALDRLATTGFDADGIVFVDADCAASPSLLPDVATALAGGAAAVQARYVVANPDASTATALRSAAFALIATVRPLGRSRLGLSAGLLGTGMGFPTALMRTLRFDTGSLVEDAELHLRLLLDGHRVAFAPGASVRSPMPSGAEAIEAQQARWEGGRSALVRRYAAPLLRRAVGGGDAACASALVELAIPPLSLLGLAHVLVTAAAPAGGGPGVRRAAALDGALAVFVLGGMRVAGEPASSYRALVAAPRLAADKLRLLVTLAGRGAPDSWERTAREPAAAG